MLSSLKIKDNLNISPNFSSSLDFFRWASAFMVLIGHIRIVFFQDFHSVQNAGIATYLFYFITIYTHQAVIIFFVLSGLLIGNSLIKDYLNDRIDAKRYLVSRVSRIYIVLVPALFLTFALDKTGLSFFNQNGIYGNDLVANAAERVNFHSFFHTLFMLQDSPFNSFGTDVPLWSLSFEFWYYILIFVFVYAFKFFRNIKTLSICIILLSLFFTLLSPKVLLYFAVWLSGFFVNFFHKVPRWLTYITAVLALAFLCFLRIYPILSADYYLSFESDLFLALCTCVIIINSKEWSWPEIWLRVNKKLADFSYSLYIIHFPIIMLLIAIMTNFFGMESELQLSFWTFFLAIILMLVLYVVGYIFSLITEKQTPVLKTWLLNQFGK